METGNKRRVGAQYELAAARYMETLGYEIAERNYRCKAGEIDIIARKRSDEDPSILEFVFVEVKYRRSSASGAGLEAVSLQKQRRICRTADYYRMKNALPEYYGYRFDVISFDKGEMTHYKNAFFYVTR